MALPMLGIASRFLGGLGCGERMVTSLSGQQWKPGLHKLRLLNFNDYDEIIAIDQWRHSARCIDRANPHSAALFWTSPHCHVELR
jgi:hypothetical protein